MIDAALAHIAGQLNQALRRWFGVAEDMVAVSNLVEPDGSVATNVANKLVVMLVNIERETAMGREPGRAGGWGRIVVGSAPAHLNLSVMVAANFGGNNYPEALKLISAVVAFFQGRPVLDHANTPELDGGIDRLTLEIENLDTAALSNLWSVLGGKYLPSVLYKVRMVSVDPGDVKGQLAAIVRPDVKAVP
jgi:hypothetical protein